MAEITIKVEGMSCGHYVMNAKKPIDVLDGVSGSEIEIGSAKVIYDDAKIVRTDLEAAIVKAGYKIAA